MFRAGGDGIPGVGARLLVSAGGNASGALVGTDLGALVLADARRVLASGVGESKTYAAPNGGTVDVFLEAILPPVPLIVFGAGHDAVPLARLAKEVGWNVTVVDTRAARPRPERFPGAGVVLACAPGEIAARVPLSARTVAIVMTHNYHDDRALVQTLLASPARYIGVLGPRRRTERILTELADEGVTVDPDEINERLHAPVGLDIGADNPAEIALAIVGEIQAALAGRPGGHLRDRQGPIHARPGTLALPAGAITETITETVTETITETITETPACALTTAE